MSQLPKKRGLQKEMWSMVNDTETACISKTKNFILDWVIQMSHLPSAGVASQFKWGWKPD